MNINGYETEMWEAAKNRDAARFSELVSDDAVMVCGGFRCSGAQYCEIIKNFDIKTYNISDFETVAETDELIQVHYMIETKVNREENKDLEGVFHVTTTWKRINNQWKVVFNMDSRVINI